MLDYFPVGCGTGTICMRNQKAASFCDRCDFDAHTYMCGSITGYHSNTPTPAPPSPSDNCVVSEEKIYSGPATDYLGRQNVKHVKQNMLMYFVTKIEFV